MAVISDWITKRIVFISSVVFGLMGIWGGYQVIAYRVNYLDKVQTEICENIKEDNNKIWERFETDRIERLENQKAVRETNFSLQVIEIEQKRISTEIEKQTIIINKILDKIK